MIALETQHKPCHSCGEKGNVAITTRLKREGLMKFLYLCKDCEETLIEMLQDDLGVVR